VIQTWRKNPVFAARVEELIEENREEARRISLINQEQRLRAMDDRWRRLQGVIEARAAHPDYQEAPGGNTGMLCHSLRVVGSGESARVVAEFAVDNALLRELRELEKQAAIEVGDWQAATPESTEIRVVYEDRDDDAIIDVTPEALPGPQD
jgi:hypothetical protein